MLGPETQYFAEAENSQEQVFLASIDNTKELGEELNQETFSAKTLTASIFSWVDKIFKVLVSWVVKLAKK